MGQHLRAPDHDGKSMSEDDIAKELAKELETWLNGYTDEERFNPLLGIPSAYHVLIFPS